MSFESTIRDLAVRYPSLPLAQAISIASASEDGIGPATNMHKTAEWILDQPDIVALLENKKITAIKEVRARTYQGLKEAKDAVEYAIQLKADGWLSKTQLEELERETEEAIASIIRSRA